MSIDGILFDSHPAWVYNIQHFVLIVLVVVAVFLFRRYAKNNRDTCERMERQFTTYLKDLEDTNEELFESNKRFVKKIEKIQRDREWLIRSFLEANTIEEFKQITKNEWLKTHKNKKRT